MLKPEVVKALTEAKVPSDIIKDLDELLGNVSGAVAQCDLGGVSRLFFDMSETIFDMERRLPKRCPTTEAVVAALDSQLQGEFNSALFGLKDCILKQPRPKPVPKVTPKPAPKAAPKPARRTLATGSPPR